MLLGATGRYWGPLGANRSNWGSHWVVLETTGGPLVDTRGSLEATRGYWEKHLPQTLCGFFTSRMSGTRKTPEIEVLTRSEDPKEKMVDAG